MESRSLSSIIVSGAPYWEIEQKISSCPSSVNEGFRCEHYGTWPLGNMAMTPLHHAVELQRWDVVQILVEKGADVNARSKLTLGGMTPLHLALQGGWTCLLRSSARTPPLHILSLLRSESNVNVADKYNNTPFSLLVRMWYNVRMRKEELNQSRVDCGQERLLGTFNDWVLVRRCTPMEILKEFATKVNVKMLPREDIEHVIYSCCSELHWKFWGHDCSKPNWDRLLLFLTLGVELKDIDTSAVSEEQAQTAPAFLRRVLMSKTPQGRWEYMPSVYAQMNKQPMSLRLSAATVVKSQIGDLPPAEELQTLKALLPSLLANYVANVEQKAEEEYKANQAPATQNQLANLSW